MAGAATLIWRRGRELQTCAVGWADIAAGRPMARDTLFRIASMSKPVTSVAAMTLLQDGLFSLDDPITTVAPEFADMRVVRDPSGPLDDTDPAARSITFGDLLTHRSGLTYGGLHPGPLADAYAAALGGDIDSPVAPDAWIAGLAALPLIDQPGAAFHYGHSTDLLGQLLARIEGVPLGQVLARRVFAPLGMTDTGFLVPPDQRHRRASLYGFSAAGVIEPRQTASAGSSLPERPDDMAYESGGQGLWSTLDDYLAFARLFVEGGGPLLQPHAYELMVRNRLTEPQRQAATMMGMPVFLPGHGFGLGLATVLDPATASYTRGKGGVGTVSWPGALGGWWQADPTDGSVMIFLAHNVLDLDLADQGIGLGVYGAIGDFHSLGTQLKA
ncbi:MAG: class A beta-lactamase-related serine hydrolase [Caulobacteraceae bacterium]|nr:MAG: class A beta-lactamase-related serine hydrolase [Caulobacteraceae bacterium]